MLQVTRLGRKFGTRWIFRNISFSLGIGDRLVVVGPNGSGKSTLVRVIAGLLPANEGTVEAPDGIGYSAIEQQLYPNLTCAEHLEFTATMRDCDSDVDALLARVGLSDARNVFASQMSTGMKARLRMAIAVQAKPLLLILDEPGACLDETGRALVQDIVREQSTRGACILATNDPAERLLGGLELVLS